MAESSDSEFESPESPEYSNRSRSPLGYGNSPGSTPYRSNNDGDSPPSRYGSAHSRQRRYVVRSRSRSESPKSSKKDESNGFGELQRKQFASMRSNGILTDIVVKCEDASLPCHKLILASASSFFERMFQVGMREVQENEVSLNGFEESTFRLILDYMYSGNIDISWDNIDEILWGADFLQMESLKKDCGLFLFKFLDAKHALRIYKLAKTCNLGQTEEDAWDIIKSEFKDVITAREFRELSLEDLIDIIKSDELLIRDEDIVFRAVSIWVKFNTEERKPYFMERLLPLVRFEYCTIDFLCHITNHEELMSSEPCQAMLAKALVSSRVDSLSSDTLPKTRPRSKFYSNYARIVLYGGLEENDLVNETMWYFNNSHYADGKTGEWVKIQQSLPYELQTEPLFRYNVCQIPYGFFLSGGQEDDGQPSSRNYSYDVLDNHWTAQEDMPVARYGHGSVYSNSVIFVIGGETFTGPTEEVTFFDTKTQSWVYIADELPQPVSYPAVTAFGLSIYVFGGSKSGTYIHHTQIFDQVLDGWRVGSPMPVKQAHATAVTYKDSIFVVGGYRGSVCLNYSPACDTWALLNAPLHDHADAAAIVYKDCIMLCGGAFYQDENPHENPHDLMECYNIGQNQWEEVDADLKPFPPLPKKLRFISFSYLDIGQSNIKR